MPNINVTTYLSDDDYIKYIGKKRIINSAVKQLVKEMINGYEKR